MPFLFGPGSVTENSAVGEHTVALVGSGTAASAAASGAMSTFLLGFTDACVTERGWQLRVGWFTHKLTRKTHTPLRRPSRSQTSPSAHETPFGVLPAGKPTPSADICIMQSVRRLPPPGTREAAASRGGAAITTATASDVSSARGTTDLLGGGQPLHVGGDRRDVVVLQLLQNRRVLRIRLDRGGDVGVGHPGHLRVAGERGHLEGLAGRRVGVARRAVTGSAVLLEDRRTVGCERDAGDGERESSHDEDRVRS